MCASACNARCTVLPLVKLEKPHVLLFLHRFSCQHSHKYTLLFPTRTYKISQVWVAEICVGFGALIMSIGVRLLTAAAPLITLRCVCWGGCAFLLRVFLSYTWIRAPPSTVKPIYHRQTKRPKPAAHFTFISTALIFDTPAAPASKTNQQSSPKNRYRTFST